MSISDNRDIVYSPVIIRPRKEALPMKTMGMNLLHNVFLHIFVQRTRSKHVFSQTF